MKKLTKVLTLCLLAAVLALVLSACGKTVSTEHVHEWGKTIYRWTGTTGCEAARICQTDSSHVERVSAKEITEEKTKDPSCDEDGEIVYTAVFSAPWAGKTVKREKIPALGHEWGDPVYQWDELHQNCTAVRTCLRDGSHTETASARVSADFMTDRATCTEPGSASYTAVFEEKWAERQTAVVDAPALGHDFSAARYDWIWDWKEPEPSGEPWTEDGWKDTVYEWKYEWNESRTLCTVSCTASRTASDNAKKVEKAEAYQISVKTLAGGEGPVPAARAEYTASSFKPAWNEDPVDWADDRVSVCTVSCSAVRTCSREACGHSETVPGTISVSTTATCTRSGRTAYAVLFPESAGDWTETQTAETKDTWKLGHDWDPIIDYEWNADHTVCTAVRTCRRDPSHTSTAVAKGDAVRAVYTGDVCTGTGKVKYKATFADSWAGTMESAETDIGPLGHDWDPATHKCRRCGAVQDTVAGLVFTRAGTAWTVSGWTQPENFKGEIEIPLTYTDEEGNSGDVTCIDYGAFRGKTNIKKISVPARVSEIRDNAFNGCSSLESVNIPSDARLVGVDAFAGTKWYENRPDGPVVLNGWLLGFKGEMPPDTRLVSAAEDPVPDNVFVLPASTTGVADAAFRDCGNLSVLELPSGVRYVGKEAFAGCSSLSGLSVPSGAALKPNAFKDCGSVRTASLPAEALKEVVDGNRDTLETVFVNGGEDIPASAFKDCARLKSVSLPDETKTIGAEAFSGCSALSGITVPAGVTSVGSRAFDGCRGITVSCAASLPAGSSRPEGWDANWNLTGSDVHCPVVWDCDNPDSDGRASDGYLYFVLDGLRYRVNPDQTPSAAAVAPQPSDVSAAIIPDTVSHGGRTYPVTAIAEAAFMNCADLTEVRTGRKIASSGKDAFAGCVSLEKVSAPDMASWCGISFSGAEANPLCNGADLYFGEDANPVSEIVIPDGVNNIGSYAFCGSRIKSVYAPESVKRVNEGAFKGCSSLEKITLPAGLETVGENAFAGCTGITEAVLPAIASGAVRDSRSVLRKLELNGGKKVPQEAFRDCLALEEATLPEGLEEIDQWAFHNCPALTETVIPASVNFIRDHAFTDCRCLTLYFETKDDNPSNWTGCGTCPKVLDCNTNDVATDGYAYTVRDGLRYRIKGEAAEVAAQSVRLSGDKVIPAEITYKNSTYPVSGIVEGAFSGCTDLAGLELGGNVRIVGKSAFSGCSKLKTVSVPVSVLSVGADAFRDCAALRKVIIDGDGGLAAWCGIEFGTDANPLSKAHALYVKGADGAEEKITEIVLDGSVEKITAGAFRGLSEGLTKLEIKDGTVSVGREAFRDCSVLSDITLPASLTEVGADAFAGTKWFAEQQNGIVILGGAILGCKGEVPSVLDFADVSGARLIADRAFYGANINRLVVPAGVKHVGANAFCECTSLYEASLPGDVESVVPLSGSSGGEGSFAGCAYLSIVSAPADFMDRFPASGLTDVRVNGGTIGDNQFGSSSGYNALGRVSVLDGVSVGANAFRDRTTLTEVYVSPDAGTVADTAFAGCKIKTAELPAGKVKPVTETNGETLESVTIKGGESLPAGAFKNCVKLTSVSFMGEGITGIGANAFEGCKALTVISLPSSLTEVPDNAFKGCEKLENVCIQNGVLKIGASAFEDCKALKTLTLPDSVKEIGEGAFRGCIALTALPIPGSVERIGASAFTGCSKAVGDVLIPASVKEMGAGAFTGCSGLSNKKTVISDLNAWCGISFGDAAANPLSLTKKLYVRKDGTDTQITELSPESFSSDSPLTGIKDYVFRNCVGVSAVSLPDTVTEIGKEAFGGCTNLKTVSIPASAETIAADAFKDCPITTATMPSSAVSSIPAAKVTEVVINGGAEIAANAFSGYTNLAAITIPASGTSVAEGAFSGCAKLAAATIPAAAIKSIPKAALKTVVINGGSAITEETGTFRNCSVLESITLPASVENICADAFACESPGTKYLSRVVTKDVGTWCGITFGNAYANPLWSKGNLYIAAEDGTVSQTPVSALEIPSSVQTIKPWAFHKATCLTSVVFESVETIGESAFAGCTKLASVTVTNTVKKMDTDAFKGCNALAKVILSTADNGLEKWCGIEFANADANPLRCTNAALYVGSGEDDNKQTELTISGVSKIADYAFVSCKDLSKVEISSGVSAIGKEAFSGCAALKTVSIPASAETIGADAFKDCPVETLSLPVSAIQSKDETPVKYVPQSKLKTVTIIVPENEEADIPDGAFENCSTLTSVTLPEGVKSIGGNAFKGCKALAGITAPETLAVIGDSAFEGCAKLASVRFGKGMASVGADAFKDCSASVLTKVIIAADGGLAAWCGITFANADANPLHCAKADLYLGENKIDKLEIPSGVTKIGANAFRNGTQFTSVTIPVSVNEIGADAFAGCSATNLTKAIISSKGGLDAWCGITFANADANPLSVAKKLYLDADAVNAVKEITIPGVERTEEQGGGKEIKAYAFYNCASLQTVTIPEDVKSVGTDAFKGCTFTAVTMPYALLGSMPYTESNNVRKYTLKTVVLNDTDEVTIGANAFAGYTNLVTITIPNTATVESGAFTGIAGLKTATIPTKAINMMPSTGEGESRKVTLTELVLNDGADETNGVEIPALEDYKELVTVTIPASITRIADDAFKDCAKLNTVIIEDLTAWCKLQFGSGESHPMLKAKELKLATDAGLSSITQLVIPDEVESISDFAFRNCKELTSVTIPANVKSIGNSSFEGCTKLATVTFSGTPAVTSIGPGAFRNCSALAGITIPSGVTAISADTFNGCSALETFVIPDGVTTIGAHAFYDCKKLKEITVPSSLTTVGESAFGCDTTVNITGGKVILADTEKGLEKWCGIGFADAQANPLYNLRNLWIGDQEQKTIDIPSSIPTRRIEKYAFYNCAMTAVSIPRLIAEIGEDAFKGCKLSAGVTINDLTAWCSVKLGNEFSNPLSAYRGGSLNIPGLTTEDDKIYFEFTSGLTEIKNYTFAFCNYKCKLASLSIPASVREVGPDAFKGCEIIGASLPPAAIKGIPVYDKNDPLESVTIVVPDHGAADAFKIPEKAFKNHKNLKTVSISDRITEIGPYAFSECEKLGMWYDTEKKEWKHGGKVRIPASVTKIGDYAFENCKSELSDVEIPDSVEYIGKGAFIGCAVLGAKWEKPEGESNEKWVKGGIPLNIPSCVRYIGESAFAGCVSMDIDEASIPEDVEYIGSSSFDNTYWMASVTDNVAAIGGWALNFQGVMTDDYTLNFGNNEGEISGIRHIAPGAFADKTKLKTVNMAEVKTIGDGAFSGCTNLSSVRLPSSLESIGKNAFMDCDQTKLGTVSDGVWTLQNWVIGISDEVPETVALGSNIEGIADGAFRRKQADNSFAGCGTVKHIVLGTDTKHIGKEAFAGCTALETVSVKNSLSYAGKDAFKDCGALNKVTVESIDKWCGVDFGNAYANPLWKAGNLYEGESEITGLNLSGTDYTVGTATKKEIKPYVFYGCTSATSLTVQSGVSRIGLGAFANCTGLTEITLPDSLLDIAAISLTDRIDDMGANAFAGCDALMIATIPAIAVRAVPKDALTTITINSGTEIPGSRTLKGEFVLDDDIPKIPGCAVSDDGTRIPGAFEGCASLTSVTLPSTLTAIGADAFNGCSTLTFDTSASFIPASVTSVGRHAFLDTKWYTEQENGLVCLSGWILGYKGDLPAETTTVDITGKNPKGLADYAFENLTAMTAVKLEPDDTVYTNFYIGAGAFSGCTGLTSIKIPKNVREIRDYTFMGCTGLGSGFESGPDAPEAVTDWNQIVSIGTSAFERCSALRKITLPPAITRISADAFYNCDNLERVRVPDSIENIADYAFRGCNAIKYVVTPAVALKAIPKNALVEAKIRPGVSSIEDNKTIPASAFTTAGKLTTVIIDGEDFITSIGKDAFSGCTALANMTQTGQTGNTIPHGVTTVGENAFSGCTSLETLGIPDTVTGIGKNAFYGCSSLTAALIPDSVTSIKSGTFSDCKSLARVSVPAGLTTSAVATDAFSGCTKIAEAAMPVDVICRIPQNPQNSLKKVTIVAADDATDVRIPDNAFRNCKTLSEVVMDKVTAIGEGAFEGCTSLTGIEIGASITGYVPAPDPLSAHDLFIEKSEGNFVPGVFYVFDKYEYEEAPDLLPDPPPQLYVQKGEGEWEEAPDSLPDPPPQLYVRKPVYKLIDPADVTREMELFVKNDDEEYVEFTGGFYVETIGKYAFKGCRSLVIGCAVSKPSSGKPEGWNETWRHLDAAGTFKCPVVWSCGSNDAADDGFIYVVEGGVRYALRDESAEGGGKTARVVKQPDGLSGTEEGFAIPNAVSHGGSDYTVTGIDENAFGDTEWYGSLPNGVATLGKWVLGYKNPAGTEPSVKTAELPADAVGIADGAFRGLVWLNAVVRAECGDKPSLPINLKYIGAHAFGGCTSLTDVGIGQDVTSIGTRAFEGCVALTARCEKDEKPAGWAEDWNLTADEARCPVVWNSDHSRVADDGYVYKVEGLLRYALKETEDGGATSRTARLVKQPRNLDNLSGIGETVTGPDGFSYTIERIEAGAFAGTKWYASTVDGLAQEGGWVICWKGSMTENKEIEIGTEVTGIADEAFKNQTNIATLKIPASVKYVYDNCFEGCSKIKIAVIPADKIETILTDSKNSLTEVTVIKGGGPDGTGIPGNAFENCAKLKKVTVSDGIASIGASAFSGCSALETATLPGSMSNIGTSAFNGCEKLAAINLGNVSVLGDKAFNGCAGLTELTILNVNINIAGKNAFTGCGAIEKANIPTTVIELIEKTELAEITISGLAGSEIGSEIGDNAFKNCKKLEKVTVLQAIKTIGAAAFSGCTGLKNVTMADETGNPASLAVIGANAFEGCTSLTSLELPASVETIGASAFKNCRYLAVFAIPENVMKIAAGTFEGCASLPEIKIRDYFYVAAPDILRAPAPELFVKNADDTYSPAPDLFVEIYESAGYPIEEGTELYVKDDDYGNYSEAPGLFVKGEGEGEEYTAATYPIASDTELFVKNADGTYIAAPALYVKTGTYASATYPVARAKLFVKNDGEGETYSPAPELYVNIVTVGEYAFKGCGSLTIKCAVSKPESGEPTGWSASWRNLDTAGTSKCPVVWNCEDPASPGIADDGFIYVVEGGVRYALRDETADGGGTTARVVKQPAGLSGTEEGFGILTAVTHNDVSYAVTGIDENAFVGTLWHERQTTGLLYIDIPPDSSEHGTWALGHKGAWTEESLTLRDITGISDGAFRDCASVKSVKLPPMLIYPGTDTFAGCDSIETATVPVFAIGSIPKEHLTTVTINGGAVIPDESFSGYPALKTVNVKESVTGIGADAFKDCAALETLRISDLAKWCGITFGNEYSNPMSNRSDEKPVLMYLTDRNISETLELPDAVRTINDHAFYNCAGLRTVVIPADATVGDNAFKGCGGIVKATMPVSAIGKISSPGTLRQVIINGGTSIGDDSFDGCTVLDAIAIPLSVTSIAESAFAGCPIKTAEIPADLVGSIPRDNLVSVTIIGEEGRSEVGKEAFKDLANLVSVTIQPGVTKIGEGAFGGCSSLGGVAITDNPGAPSVLAEIGTNAFENCINLWTIEIPTSVDRIIGTPFAGCDNLVAMCKDGSQPGDWDADWNLMKTDAAGQKVYCPVIWGWPTNAKTEEGAGFVVHENIMYKITEESLATVWAQPSSLEEEKTIPVTFTEDEKTYTVTGVKEEAFVQTAWYKNKPEGLISMSGWVLGYKGPMPEDYALSIPENTTGIADGAFRNQANLTSVTILSGNVLIGTDAFAGCDGITSLTVHASMTGQVPTLADKLETLVINGGGTIGADAFKGYTALKSVTVSDGVKITDIGKEAFSGCTSLATVTIPDADITHIGADAFAGTAWLGSKNAGEVVYLSDSWAIAFKPAEGGSSAALTLKDGTLGIADGAFKNQSFDSITVPDSVTSIGANAFAGCTGIKNAAIPTALIPEIIGSNKETLETVTINSGEEVPDNAFKDCTVLKTVTFGGTPAVTSIGSGAFQNCSKLTKITIPSGVTEIKANTFNGCTALATVVIPASVNSIGTDAFTGCGGITSLTVPASIIGQVPTTAAKLETLVINGDGAIGANAFKDYTALKSVTVSEGVKITDIGSEAFSGCTNLATVTVQNGVKITDIGKEAFSGCTALATVTIPDADITHIGADAFAGTAWLNNQTAGEVVYLSTDKHWAIAFKPAVQENPEEDPPAPAPDPALSLSTTAKGIADGAFKDQRFASISIPNGLKHIGAGAFENCTGYTAITVPDSVTSIGANAFAGCTGIKIAAIPTALIPDITGSNKETLETVTINSGTSIPDDAFKDCTVLESVTFGGTPSVTSIGSGAFQNCSKLTKITIPSGVTEIKANTFNGCGALATVVIPAGVNSIGVDAFADAGVKKVTMPVSAIDKMPKTTVEEVTLNGGSAIPDSAFSGYSALKKVSFGDTVTVTDIGKEAFSGCTKLATVSITSAAAGAITHIGADAFAGTAWFNNKTPNSVVYLVSDGKWAVGYKGTTATGALTLAHGASIADGAFKGLGFTSIIFPSSGVKHIGAHAFENCTGLTTITFPTSVQTIGDYAFSGCTGLTKITLPSNVKTIGESAFSGCTSLQTITFSGSTTAWNNVRKGTDWASGVPATQVTCTQDSGSVPV